MNPDNKIHYLLIYHLKKLGFILTCSAETWQKFEIFAFTVSPIFFSERQTIKSGRRPKDLNSLTLAWVGLVFCSPVADGCGTNDTWKKHIFSLWKLKFSTKNCNNSFHI